MSSRHTPFVRLMLGATFLAGAMSAPAYAQTLAVAETGGTPSGLQPHDIAAMAAQAVADAAKAPAQMTSPSLPAVAAEGSAGPVAAIPATAADAARDSAATTTICEGYFAVAQSLAPLLQPAAKALQTHDVATLSALLPSLQAQLDQLPADEIRPELCGGNHINAYTREQFEELSVLRAHGVDTGFPANLPLVKQPELNQAGLAFVVGWTRYEQKDFTGALAALGKGLAMFPHDHALQAEYIGTLMQLKEGSEVIIYVDSVLNGTYDLDDKERANLFLARATGLLLVHALDAADQSLTLSLRYSYSDQVKALQNQLRAARAGTLPPAAQAPAPAK